MNENEGKLTVVHKHCGPPRTASRLAPLPTRSIIPRNPTPAYREGRRIIASFSLSRFLSLPATNPRSEPNGAQRSKTVRYREDDDGCNHTTSTSTDPRPQVVLPPPSTPHAASTAQHIEHGETESGSSNYCSSNVALTVSSSPLLSRPAHRRTPGKGRTRGQG